MNVWRTRLAVPSGALTSFGLLVGYSLVDLSVLFLDGFFPAPQPILGKLRTNAGMAELLDGLDALAIVVGALPAVTLGVTELISGQALTQIWMWAPLWLAGLVGCAAILFLTGLVGPKELLWVLLLLTLALALTSWVIRAWRRRA